MKKDPDPVEVVLAAERLWSEGAIEMNELILIRKRMGVKVSRNVKKEVKEKTA